ncbi:MAG: hypothetical protein RIC14_05480 [Filomicrobium sp.]
MSDAKISEYEEQKIKNDLSFQLLSRTHVLERALEQLVNGKIRKAHAWLLRCFARSLGAAEGGTVTLNRDEVCAELGISRDTLRKRIYELRSMGYIKGDIVSNGKSRSEFVLGDNAIDHARIMTDYATAIAKFCDAERAKRAPETPCETVPNSGTSHTQGGDKPYPEPGQTVPKTGIDRTQNRDCEDASPSYEDNNNNPPIVPPQGKRRGTRLPDNWKLPRAWGQWALEEFDVSADEIRETAARFKDYWTSITGIKATKVDWQATWRNWCRNDKRSWKRRRVDSDIAPDLIDGPSKKSKNHDPYAEDYRDG